MTGGTGFLGKFLIKHLCAQNYSVINVTRRDTYFEKISNSKNINIDQIDKLTEKFQVKAFIHLATTYPNIENTIGKIRYSNVDLPLKIIEKLNFDCNPMLILADSFFSKFEIKRRNCAYTASKNELVDIIRDRYPNATIVRAHIEHMYGEFDNPNKFIPRIYKN